MVARGIATAPSGFRRYSIATLALLVAFGVLTGMRRMISSLLIAALSLLEVYALVVRPRLVRWGATAWWEVAAREPQPGGRTRLVVSGYLEPSTWLMQTRQLAGLKRRAERAVQTGVQNAQFV